MRRSKGPGPNYLGGLGFGGQKPISIINVVSHLVPCICNLQCSISITYCPAQTMCGIISCQVGLHGSGLLGDKGAQHSAAIAPDGQALHEFLPVLNNKHTAHK
eukprot:EG_transcript_47706